MDLQTSHSYLLLHTDEFQLGFFIGVKHYRINRTHSHFKLTLAMVSPANQTHLYLCWFCSIYGLTYVRECIQKFPDRVGNEINNN